MVRRARSATRLCRACCPLASHSAVVHMTDEDFEDEGESSARLPADGEPAPLAEGDFVPAEGDDQRPIPVFPEKTSACEDAPRQGETALPAPSSSSDAAGRDALPAWAAAEIQAAAEAKVELSRIRQELDDVKSQRAADSVLRAQQEEAVLRRKLGEFYSSVGANKQHEIPKIAHDFWGREAELSAALRGKYGKGLEEVYPIHDPSVESPNLSNDAKASSRPTLASSPPRPRSALGYNSKSRKVKSCGLPMHMATTNATLSRAVLVLLMPGPDSSLPHCYFQRCTADRPRSASPSFANTERLKASNIDASLMADLRSSLMASQVCVVESKCSACP
jgi:hypothetical protein